MKTSTFLTITFALATLFISGCAMQDDTSTSDTETSSQELVTQQQDLRFKSCMQPSYVQSEGLDIAYYESKGKKGPGIMLIHGNSSSSKVWRKQLCGSLGNKYRIVAIDLPGHGESDNPADINFYITGGLSRVLADTADQLDVDEGVFVGWSLGGALMLETYSMLPDAKGFFMFGHPPLGIPQTPVTEAPYYPNPVINYGFVGALPPAYQEDYVNLFFKPNTYYVPQFFYDDMARTDPNFRDALGYLVVTNGFTDQIATVANMTQPLAIVHGEEEQIANLAYMEQLSMPTLYKDEIKVIPHSGHATQWEAPVKFNQALKKFVKSVDK